jgi:hypothetical protein
MWDRLTDKYRKGKGKGKGKGKEPTRGINLGEEQNTDQGNSPDMNR